jgi:hypothetical protein
MVDDQAGVGIDGRLHIVGRRLRSLANPHRPGIELALHQRGALLGIELGGQAIEFSTS